MRYTGNVIRDARCETMHDHLPNVTLVSAFRYLASVTWHLLSPGVPKPASRIAKLHSGSRD